jgi:hypothetical protein
MSGVIWFWPGVILAIPLALLCARPVARALGTNAWLAWFLALSVAVIMVATLTPIHRRPGFDPALLRTCDLSRQWFASLGDLRTANDISLNIALFVPLGLAIALLPFWRQKLTVAVAAVIAPFAIETLQYGLPVLNRGCQSGDVIDNLTGLALGLAVGSTGAWLASRLAAQRR